MAASYLASAAPPSQLHSHHKTPHPLSPQNLHTPFFFPSPWKKLLTRRHPFTLTFISPLHPKPPKVSLQDPPPQTTTDPSPDPLQTNQSTTESTTPTFKNSIWVNPNNPHAARLRHQSNDSRNARLTKVSQSLDSCAPTEIGVSQLMPENPTEQDAVIILNNMENSANAVIVLRWFQSNVKLYKEVILYNVSFKVLRKCRNWDGVETLLKEMLEKGVKPDNVTFSTVISCARQCNLPAKAVEVFERMPEFGISPDAVTYSAMIDAYGRSGNVDMALELYDKARKEKWKIDPVTFATVIKIYGLSGNFDGALNVFEEMKALGVKPNLVIFNTLLDAMGRASRPWQVKTIFKEMCGNGLVPNRITYSALLRAYSRARYAEDALKIFREMKEKEMYLNIILYNMLLSMCADIGLVDEAIGIFEEMRGLSDDCKPDSWSYSSLITVYSCSGRVSDAEGILNEMIEAGFQPNIFVLTSLIQCYGKAKQTDDVVRTFDRLMELGITPDDRFCGCLLNVVTQTSKEELGKVISCIDRANVQLGSLVRLLVSEESVNEEIKQEAEELFGNVSKEVKKAYCNCLMDLCVNFDLLERGCILLDVGLRVEIYSSLQSKSSTQWSLHVKSLSLGAALTALHVWMNDLTKALENGEELPPLLGIHTGHGKHKYSEKGLAAVFEAHLRELNAPFYEAPDKVGWFLTTKVAAKSWLESRSSAELVAS